MKSVPVFYDERMVALNRNRFSPSAQKPRLIVEHWTNLNLPIDFMPVTPVSIEQLTAVHDKEYVTGVIERRLANGFGYHGPDVTESLIFTNGSLLSSACWALENNSIACTPCSGFHHAHYQCDGDFCTFNGLMVTAVEVLKRNDVKRVGLILYQAGADPHIDDALGGWMTTEELRYREQLEEDDASQRH